VIIDWKDETELWEFQVPRLRGWWRRLEAVTPEGMPDSFGIFDKQTHWLERKIGRPSKDALRPKQIEFGLECMKRSISYHVCFGYKGDVIFFKDFSFTTRVYPAFWVQPSERLSQLVQRSAWAAPIEGGS